MIPGDQLVVVPHVLANINWQQRAGWRLIIDIRRRYIGLPYTLAFECLGFAYISGNISAS